MRINVECDNREGDHVVPFRFFLGKRSIQVTEVIDRWPGHDHCYFKVQGDDGGIYMLRHDMEELAWNLTMFASSNARNTQQLVRSTVH